MYPTLLREVHHAPLIKVGDDLVEQAMCQYLAVFARCDVPKLLEPSYHLHRGCEFKCQLLLVGGAGFPIGNLTLKSVFLAVIFLSVYVTILKQPQIVLERPAMLGNRYRLLLSDTQIRFYLMSIRI